MPRLPGFEVLLISLDIRYKLLEVTEKSNKLCDWNCGYEFVMFSDVI